MPAKKKSKKDKVVKMSSARKTSKLDTRVYEYGAILADESVQADVNGATKFISDQVFLQYQYKRELIGIENALRAKRSEIYKKYDEQIGSLELEISGIYSIIKDLRAGLKEKSLRESPDQQELISKIKSAYASIRVLEKKISSCYKKVDETFFVNDKVRYDLIRGFVIYNYCDQNEKERLASYNKSINNLISKIDESAIINIRNAALKMLDDLSMPASYLTIALHGLYLKHAKRHLEEEYKNFRLLNNGIGPHTLAKLNKQSIEEFISLYPDSLYLQILSINTDANNKIKDAREICGCAVGTYQAAESAVEQAKKSTILNISTKKFDGTGIIAPGNCNIKVSDLFGTTKGVSIQFTKRLSSTKYKRIGILKINFGNKVHKKVICFSVVFHRPLPVDAVIKNIQIKVSKIGYRTIYKAQFVLESGFYNKIENGRFVCEDGSYYTGSTREISTENRGKLLGLAIGWQTIGSDIRAAVGWNGFDSSDAINFDGKFFQASDNVKKYLKASDKHFDVAIKYLGSFLSDNSVASKVEKVINSALPHHLQFDKNTAADIKNIIIRWNDHKKLQRVVRALVDEFCKDYDISKLWIKWKADRLNGFQQTRRFESRKTEYQIVSTDVPTDKKRDLFGTWEEMSTWFRNSGITDEIVLVCLCLEWWRRKDDHLINSARSLEKSLVRHRLEKYRVFAAKLASKYEYIIIRDVDLSEVAENPNPEDDERTQQEEKSNANRQKIGVSVLINCIKQSFGNRMFEIKGEFLSNHIDCSGKSSSIIGTTQRSFCVHCGKTYDRAENLAKQLYCTGARDLVITKVA